MNERTNLMLSASQIAPVDCSSLAQPQLIADVDDAVASSPAGRDSAAAAAAASTSDDVSGYLASYYAQTLGHGRPDCPWTIAVRPGQRIQLMLIDFSTDARYRVDGGGGGAGHSAHHDPGPQPASAASAVDPPDFCYRYVSCRRSAHTLRPLDSGLYLECSASGV